MKVVDRCKNIFKLAQGEYIAPEKLELVYQQSALISQIFVDGDAHSTFPVALVVPEVGPLLRALSNHSPKSPHKSIVVAKSKPSLEDICADPRAKKLVMADLKSLSEAANFMGFEKVIFLIHLSLDHSYALQYSALKVSYLATIISAN